MQKTTVTPHSSTEGQQTKVGEGDRQEVAADQGAEELGPDTFSGGDVEDGENRL